MCMIYLCIFIYFIRKCLTCIILIYNSSVGGHYNRTRIIRKLMSKFQSSYWFCTDAAKVVKTSVLTENMNISDKLISSPTKASRILIQESDISY